MAGNLNKFNYSLPPGSCSGFLGNKGSGNRTAVKILLDLLKADEGTVKIFGSLPTSEIAPEVGYCPEYFSTFPGARAVKVLSLFETLKSSSSASASSLRQKLQINPFLKSKFKQLTPDQKKRLGLTAALLNDPRLLILIEPTTDLAPEYQEKLYKLINRRKKEEHKSTLIVTSQTNLTRRLCSQTEHFEQSTVKNKPGELNV